MDKLFQIHIYKYFILQLLNQKFPLLGWRKGEKNCLKHFPLVISHFFDLFRYLGIFVIVVKIKSIPPSDPLIGEPSKKKLTFLADMSAEPFIPPLGLNGHMSRNVSFFSCITSIFWNKKILKNLLGRLPLPDYNFIHKKCIKIAYIIIYKKF